MRTYQNTVVTQILLSSTLLEIFLALPQYYIYVHCCYVSTPDLSLSFTVAFVRVCPIAYNKLK